jgi:hypothetical protein
MARWWLYLQIVSISYTRFIRGTYWVPPEDWEATASAHREMFEGMLQAVLTNENPDDDEPIKDEGDLREIWPFDI